MPRLVVADRKGARHECEARAGSALMFVLRDDAGLPAEGLSGGSASCGAGHVHVAGDRIERLPPRETFEVEMLEQLGYFDAHSSRLSCQIRATPQIDGLSLTLAPEA